MRYRVLKITVKLQSTNHGRTLCRTLCLMVFFNYVVFMYLFIQGHLIPGEPVADTSNIQKHWHIFRKHDVLLDRLLQS